MHHSFKALILTLIMCSCAPVDLLYKPTVTNAQQDTDTKTCALQAANEVPANIQSRYVPAVYRYEPVCNGTSCYNRQILVIPARWEQYDANSGLRASATRQCMLSKGYGQISLPRCEENVSRGHKFPGNVQVPKITKQSCVVRDQSKVWRIITPK